MIISYLPSGGGGNLPPIPDKSYFTYGYIEEELVDESGEPYTVSKLVLQSCDFTNFSGESVTIPDKKDNEHIYYYDISTLFKTDKLGNVKTVYFTNTNYSFYASESAVSYNPVTIFPTPIQEVHMAYFTTDFKTPHTRNYIALANGNTNLRIFESQNSVNVSSIGDDYFNSCSSLLNNPFPNARVIGSKSFYNSSIKGEDLLNVENINGSYAFASCSGIIDLNMPNLTSMQNGNIFNSCSGLKTVKMPNLISLNSSACFSNCSNLNTIYLDNLTNLTINFSNQSNSPFYRCTSLEHIYTKAENVDYLKSIFSGCAYTAYGSNLVNIIESIPEEEE